MEYVQDKWVKQIRTNVYSYSRNLLQGNDDKNDVRVD